jgi:hypothetical protein
MRVCDPCTRSGVRGPVDRIPRRRPRSRSRSSGSETATSSGFPGSRSSLLLPRDELSDGVERRQSASSQTLISEPFLWTTIQWHNRGCRGRDPREAIARGDHVSLLLAQVTSSIVCARNWMISVLPSADRSMDLHCRVLAAFLTCCRARSERWRIPTRECAQDTASLDWR